MAELFLLLGSENTMIKLIFKQINYLFPIITCLFTLSLCISCFLIYTSPSDYQQDDFVKIMYIHVPSAWLSLSIYSIIGIFSFCYLIWQNPILDIIARQSALPGAAFTFITLTTGTLWGKPIWGTWWAWDARITSLLILFFFYISYITLCISIKDEIIKSKAPAVLAIVGLINVPIIKFSVDIWSTLHQPSSIIRSGGISIDKALLMPLLSMFVTCILFCILIIVLRVQTQIMQKKILRFQYRSVR